MPVEATEVREMIKAHHRLQTGSYLERVVDLGGAMYSLGNRITDYYQNHAALVNVEEKKVPELAARVIDFSRAHHRKPAFCLDPATQPPDLGERIEQLGFELEDDEILWMFHDQSRAAPEPLNGISIEIVTTKAQMQTFVKSFDTSFGKYRSNFTYSLMTGFGKYRSGFSHSLMAAFENPPLAVEIVHYIGNLDGKVCGTASLYSSGDVGGVYNVATLRQFRRRGIGAALMVRAIRDSKERQHRLLILQTGDGSDAHRLYSKLGFEPAFLTSIYVKAKY